MAGATGVATGTTGVVSANTLVNFASELAGINELHPSKSDQPLASVL